MLVGRSRRSPGGFNEGRVTGYEEICGSIRYIITADYGDYGGGKVAMQRRCAVKRLGAEATGALARVGGLQPLPG